MYIQSHSLNTKNSYKNGLIHFENFVAQKYQGTFLTIVEQIKTGKLDSYKLLNEFVAYLDSKNLKPKTIKLCISAVKGYLRYVGIKIYSEDFRQLVKLPKARRYREEPLTKEIILRVLRNVTTKLQVVILMLVASGMRIGELVQLKISDIDFESKPTRIRIRAEITKTREGRETYLTEEATKALKDYLKRFLGWNERETNPEILDKIILQAVIRKKKGNGPKTHSEAQIAQGILRQTLLYHIAKIPELCKQNENGSYMIHFQAFRKFFRTTVGDTVGRDFAEALMGHHFYLDTYYNLPEEKRREMYLKAEPYLTISDYAKIEKNLNKISDRQNEIEEEHQTVIRILKNSLLVPKAAEHYFMNKTQK